MKRFAKILLLAVMLLAMPMKQWGQQPYRQYADDGILLNFHEIDNVYFRAFLLYDISMDDRFVLVPEETYGQFYLTATDDNIRIMEEFERFYADAETDFYLLSKIEVTDQMSVWKSSVEATDYLSIMMDVNTANLRSDNDHCLSSMPFCTSEVIEFEAAYQGGTTGENGPEYGCLSSQPYPSWYHMRINTAGQFVIHMEAHDASGVGHDIDYCIWGPFTDPYAPCVSELTCSKLIDCSYSAQAVEDVFLGFPISQHTHGSSSLVDGSCVVSNSNPPHVPQVGEYYILMITNYSQVQQTISFTKTPNSGPGETDCGILPGVVENDGPYCVGETIHLTVSSQNGATYSWTGPGGWTSTQQNPTRPNCTMAMAGTYSCTTTVGTQSTTGTTTVVIYPQPTANFNFTSVCQGNPTQFTSTSTTNPSGQQISSYQWNFGDGQTSNQQNPSHQYAAAGTYTVTLTVSTGGHCTSTKTQTVTVYPQPAANAGPDQTIAYGGTAQLSGSGGSGTFNFHWEPANMVTNANTQNTQTVPLTQDQTYTLTVTNPQGGCSSTDEVTIHINGSAMNVNAYADPSSICQGGSTQLIANAGGGTGNFTYSWTPTTGLSNPNIYNPIASPSQTTTYTCHVSDGQTSQNVTVTVTVNDIIVEDEYMTICPSDVYHWHNTPYSEVGTYQFDTVTDQGCLKTLYLHLDHYPTYDETIIEEAICFGESYSFYGTTYDSPGYYQIPYTDHTIHGCDSIVRLNLTIYPNNGVTDHPVTVCESQLPFYYEEDPNQIPLYAGDHLFHLQDIHGCDSIVLVQLSVSNYYIPPTQTEYVCYDDEPSFYWDVNGQTYHTSGSYVDTIPYSNCEGIFSLDLHFQQTPERIVFDTVVCDGYTWPVTGDNYSQSDTIYHSVSMFPYPCNREYQLNLTVNHKSVNNSDTFDGIQDHICDVFPYYNHYLGDTLYYYENINTTLNGQTPEGCDYRVQLQINNMQYTPHPVIDCSDLNVPNPHWPITATEFNVNRYNYQVTDEVSDISKWDLSQCKWDISKTSWRIVPNPSGNNPLECMVYAMDWVPDSICLSFKAVNSCSGNEGVIAEYWLHPSFYGVEEQEAYPASVSVIPNPNNGQMRLQFDNMQGDLNIKVYSLTGTLVDAFELKSIEVGQSHEYSMKRLMNGIYFFTISDGKRNVTKKVVVIH